MAFRPLRGRLAIRKEKNKVAEARHRLEDVCLKGLGGRQEKRHDSARGLDAFDSVRGDAQANANGASGRRRFTSASRPRMTGMKRLSHAHHVYSVRPSILNRCGISRTARPPKPMIRPLLSV